MKKLVIFILAAASCFSASAQRMAVVGFSVSYLRQRPDYESALETQELMGTVVRIVDEKGYWREVITPQPYKAWCTDQGLVEMSTDELAEYTEARKVMYTGMYGHVFKKCSRRSQAVCDLVGGDIMRIVRKRGGWTEVMLPSGRTGYVPSKELKRHDGFISVAQGEGGADTISPEVMENIIGQAEKLLGTPYLWGGMSSKGVDCSGLVRISCLMNGILLPRNASQQINCGDKVEMAVDRKFWLESERKDADSFRNEMATRVQNLQRGDLVFFGQPSLIPGKSPRITHVGIYLGDNRIIHSSHCVRINSLIPGDADYYENSHRLLGAVRL